MKATKTRIVTTYPDGEKVQEIPGDWMGATIQLVSELRARAGALDAALRGLLAHHAALCGRPSSCVPELNARAALSGAAQPRGEGACFHDWVMVDGLRDSVCAKCGFGRPALAPSAPKEAAPRPYVCPLCGSEWQLRYEAGSSIGYCPKCCPDDERKRLEASPPAPVSQPAQPREPGGCGVTTTPFSSIPGKGLPAPRPVKNQEYNVGCIHDPFQEVGMARPCRHEAIEIAASNLGDGALPCPVCDDGIQEKCPHCGREP